MKTGRRGGADRTMTWLAPAILCVLAGHTPVQGSAIDRETLVALSNTQPKGPIPSSFTNPGMSSAIFVPVILTASGRNNSFFTSELTLTNRGGEEATLHYTYTAHRGGGSGTATDRLAPGRQRIESDAIGYLTNLGIPIPSSGNRIGTLRVEVSGSSGVGISVRTTTLVDDGRAGLAYSGIAATAGFEEVVYLCGLRQNSRDRSNVAFQNMGAPGEGAITLRATVYSGEAGDTEPRVFEEELPPGGFHQYNGILNLAAFDNGYVKVERVEGASPFYAYGVINDNFNSDGSFVFPLTASSLTGTTAQTLPVIVETGEFTSELTVTNFSEEPKTLLFSFVADRLSTPDRTARFRLKIGAGQQRIIPDVIDTQLRRKGVEGVSSSRGGLAGALFARVERGDMSGIVIGARTSSSDGRGGHYGVFYHAAPYGGAFLKEAWVDGLQQDGENRSNLALVNTGEVNGSASVFHLEIYNGETGMLEETVVTKPIPARRQHQINGILLRSNPETRQGYIRIEKVSGENPFLAYGVVNDGGAPGERSGDGAYLTATARIYDPGTEVMTDREVLEALYHATGGPGWKNRTHWLSAAPLSEWFGVETDASGRVTRLGLSRNGLSGEIPPELCQLTHLQVLDLRFNQLSGVIPPSLGELTQLQWLNLGANQLSGGIPPELGGLIHLRGLNLASNELSGGIPPELGGLTHLEKLVLVSNQLSGEIPEELGQLSRLQELHLRGNRLSGEIPPELGQLTNLQDLNLRSNQLSGAIPPALGRLTKLRNLVLGYNELSGAIPAELGELTHLRGLDLGGNRLSGAIPKNLQQLSELTSLDIRDTGICVPADAAFRAWLETLTDFGTSGLVCDGTRRVLFSASSYEVREGETVEVVVWLIDQTGDPVQSTEIPLTAMPVGGATAADYSGVPESVTITAPATEAGFVFTAVADAPFDTGETVVLGFRGPLPSGVTAGSPDTATVTITDPGTVGVTDREVLEALHQATDGPNWSNRTHWLSAAPLSEWFGVATDGSGRVTSLALGNNRLSGTIPPSLGQLTRLQGLNLGANQLSGEIPSELGGLTHLETLQLWANQLSGAIPPELAGLTLLRGLNLGGNQLSGGIPPELAGLTHLETLHLWANQLSGAIPPELGGLTHLETLNLVSNQLSGEIPEELGQLTHLQWLSLGSNELSGAIPPELGGLTRLETLHLSANQLSGAIPPELAGLTHLETLHLWANQLSGAIPPELGQLTQLQRLVLVDNDLSGAIPPELGELTNLLWLNLGGNGLSGGIPPELGQLSRLQGLYLGTNNLSGGIPPELGQLSRLQGLYLGTNQLSGGIPPELGGLIHLRGLNLASNELSGGIPPELGGLTHLEKLVLVSNQLSGEIPEELGQLSRLQELHLRGNRLSGEIPPELGQLTNLQDLNLRSNQLSGAIPPALGRLTKLRNLVLGYNELSGAIPAELGELTHLRGLDLGGNRLSGAIPKNLQQLSELTSLDIRDTGICVPADAAFRAWLETLTDFGTSGLVCDGTRRVLFSASSYEVREGETVEVVVWLIDQTGDPVQSTEIPLTAMPVGGATAADYSGVPESVTITAPATEAGFVFTAVADAPFDTGETVVLGFRGPLPSGVTAGSPDTATVTITDPGTVGVTDREVLEALHQATDGPNWSNRTHWLSAAPLSEWFGVATDGSGRVTSLALGNNRLSGTIPPSLGQLTRLQGLNLGANQLSGEIPSELGGLTHLETLQLWANQLSGAIPPELAGLTLLRGLNLGGNQLSGGIPPELAGLTHLETLHLWANQLSGAIPPELGGLTHLETLNLVSNQLSGEIPEELGQLTHLQWLSLGSNELSGAIPPELGGLTRLETLHLSANQLSGAIPPELAGLTHLETLHLWANQLSGAIPPELGQLTQLQRLVLVDNDLSGAIPPELGELTNLLWLNLGGNGLSGGIPPELGQLSRLQGLYLGTNNLSGGIPPELGQLSRLQGLYLGTNNLSGGIPPELGGLTHLETLNLGSNELKGGIPPELGGMTHLDGLVLGFNPHLTGTIPPELQQLPLSTLNLMATSVCVSEDAELQEWLATIEFVSSGLTCGRPPPAMPSIDILVVYTPTARSIAGGTAEMEAEIDLKIAETNQAYLDGGVNQRLVLVAREEVEYSGSGSGFVDLRRLADASDGYMDEVHAIRDRSGADLLHLIADVTDVGGVAFLGGAYGITCAKCGSGTFAHELGHNMGLHHDRYVQRSAPFPYSHGYVNQQAFTNGAPESARWRTIMAYVNQCGDAGFSCDRTMRFSNPNQTYLGDPLGVPGDQRTVAVNGPADAARALNLTRHSVASFRPRASGNQLTMSSPVSQVPSLVRADRNWPAVPVPGGGLFRAVAPAVTGTGSRQAGSALDRATLRRREVSVDIGRLARLPSSGSTALRLNLFDDVVLTGIIERRTLTYSGGYALSGRLAGVAGGSVTLVVNGSVVAGTVRIPGATYRIRPAGAGRHAIMQVDPSQLPQGCETLRGTPDWEQ